MNRLKKFTILVSSVLTLSAHTITVAPAVLAEEVDPAYGAENGFDLINLSKDKPKVAPVEARNTPNRIATSLTKEPTTSMAFNWYTTDKMDGAIVKVSKSDDMSDAKEFKANIEAVTSEYAERDENGYYIYSAAKVDDEGNLITNDKGEPAEIVGYFTDEQITRDNTQWTADGSKDQDGKIAHLGLVDVKEHIYKATADGLEADTQYYYQVGSADGGFSEVGSFRTAGKAGQEFQFIHYTDTQNAYWNANVNNEAAYGADTVNHALEIAPEADFALHTGDFVETAQVEDEWVDNLDMSQAANLNLPHVYTPGNHDEYTVRWNDEKDLTAFNEHTNVPITNEAVSGGSYYSFDYNGAHFVVLNTNDNKADKKDNPEAGAIGKAQMEWAKKDIKKAKENGANWIVMAYHKPVYSASYHALQDEDVQVVREQMVQVADELGVDIVLQGHDHNLTRTKSLTYTPDNFAYGQIEDTQKETIDGVEYHVNPKGVTYVIPNTSGTKTYDAIYQKGADHVAKVRPKLDWMTDKDTDLRNSLFDIAARPENSPKFAFNHDNYRQSAVQNFASYTVSEDKFLIEFYQVSGDLHNGEERTVELINSYGIVKK
ncbi:serine/threonine protein phosphatase [Aerococcus urinaehominis]|uniref:Serine/threonine protein phosphatase n=1 Tax=Aerococcus urinaehominis TaxID=128944 RepID=A0A0X8FLE7_9LACT|nr:metallophosphoesterase family protein [Aerococcus urinaehominis]AMB99465.1 serine/threonine protein phosphatase [Aerococcus urinaehominis]SDM61540.1 Calcineurin-like phosphoesterase [Aerococcus urinaehominis]